MRETVKVGGFGKLAGLREHGEKRIKHWLSQSSDTLMGVSSVSGREEEGGGHGERQEEEERERER